MNPDIHLLYFYVLKHKWQAEMVAYANNRYVIKVSIAYLREMEDDNAEDHFLVTLVPQ
jgi:hypothetical protein